MSPRNGLVCVILCLLASPLRATPSYHWSHFYGDPAEQTLAAVAIDPSGNVLLTGSFYGSVTFATAMNSAGNDDMFIAKLGPSGNALWNKRLGFSLQDDGIDITSDTAGNVIAVGWVGISWRTLMMFKYSPTGTFLWSKTIGTADGIHQPFAVATNAANEIMVAGFFEGRFFDPDSHFSDSDGDIFLAKFDQNGNRVWSTPFTSQGDTHVKGVEVDALGQIVMFGQFAQSIDFGNGPLNSAGFGDLFLVKFASQGVPIWSQRYGSTGIDEAACLALSDGGRAAIGVNLFAPIDFGGGVLTPANTPQPAVAVFTPAGDHLWSRTMPTTLHGLAYGMAFAENSDLLFSCYGQGTFQLGGAPVAGTGSGYNTYVARYFQNTGSHRWSTAFAGDGNLVSFVEESENGLVLAGNTEGSVDFGGGALLFQGEIDVFAARYHEVLTAIGDGPVLASLDQNIPNPFNPTTTIRYTLHEPARVAIVVYSASGQSVRRLDQGARSTGLYHVEWDGRDDAGRDVASGVYFYRLEGVADVAARKMILLK
jgi:hypothetical protein